MLDFAWLGQEKKLTGTQTIPGIPFPVPAFASDPAVALQAISALQKAASNCPSLAVPGGPLQHAAGAFATFAAVSKALGGTGQESLDALHEQLDGMCPTWRGTAPVDAVPVPPPANPITGLLNQLMVMVGADNFGGLTAIATQMASKGFPKTASQVNQLVQNPPETVPVTDETAIKTEKKEGVGGGTIVAITLAAGVVLWLVFR